MTILVAFLSINHQVLTNLKQNNPNELWKGEIEILESENYQKVWLKSWEEFEIKSHSEGTIKVLEWWPIKVNLTEVLVQTWFTIPNWNNTIVIKNLWWYASLELISKEKFDKNYKKYKIIKEVWNHTIIKKSYIIETETK
jgi:hypothetical protein